jgi:hypothetical protein
VSEELSREERGKLMSKASEISTTSTPSVTRGARMKPGTLMKDFFGRRAEDSFTYRDGRNKFFDWERETRGRSYSSYFMRDEDNPLSEASKMLGSMFRVMGINKDRKLTSKHNTIDPRHVKVPIGMLKDADGNYKADDPTVLDAFYGASLQNAALASFQTEQEYRKHLSKEASSSKLHDFFLTLLNTERVDKKLAERFPGYLKFVQKYKDYTFDEHYEPVGEEAADQIRLMDLLARMMRYPANLQEEELEEFKEPLQAVERLLKKHGGIPDSLDGCASMAQSLSNIVYKYVKKVEEEEKPEDEEGGDGPSPGLGKDEVDEAASKMMGKMMAGGAGAGAEDESAMQDFEESMEEDSRPKTDNSEEYEKVGVAEGGEKIYWDTPADNRSRYETDVHKIDRVKAAVLRKLFERKNKDYDFAIKSMRSGRFDTNKIAEAKQHVPTIYERMGTVSTNKICVGVLIDESGSMSGSNIEKARQAAIFINEVFGNMSTADLYIYGHTADRHGPRSVEMSVYREPKMKSRNKYALGSVSAKSNNRDGVAIYEAAKRIRKDNANNGILFVISDGQPAASDYGGHQGIKDTKAKVIKSEQLGFQVIQIAIDECVPSEQMFNHFIKMTNIKNLPNDMIAYMSKKIDKLIKSKITM